MFYTVYKITNIIDQKIYIGVHKTKNLNDNYMGSGKRLKYAQNKYGIENFIKEIIAIFDNKEDMFKLESEIVSEDFIKRSDTYNLRVGGFGGFDYLNNPNLYFHKYHNKEHAVYMHSKISAENKYIGINKLNLLKDIDKDWVLKRYEKIKQSRIENNSIFSFRGRKHSEETLLKMRDISKTNKLAEKNGSFGTIWIYNIELKINKKIKAEELDLYSTNGWIKGRKMNFN